MSLPEWAGGYVSSLKGEKAVGEKKDSIAHCRGSRMGPGHGHQGHVRGDFSIQLAWALPLPACKKVCSGFGLCCPLLECSHPSIHILLSLQCPPPGHFCGDLALPAHVVTAFSTFT